VGGGAAVGSDGRAPRIPSRPGPPSARTSPGTSRARPSTDVMPAASSCSPLIADRLMGVFWMVRIVFFGSDGDFLESRIVGIGSSSRCGRREACSQKGTAEHRERPACAGARLLAPAHYQVKATQDRTSFDCISTGLPIFAVSKRLVPLLINPIQTPVRDDAEVHDPRRPPAAAASRVLMSILR